jgi:hypothetical protein
MSLVEECSSAAQQKLLGLSGQAIRPGMLACDVTGRMTPLLCDALRRA